MSARPFAALVALFALAACETPFQVEQAPVPYMTLKPLNEVGTSSFMVRAVNTSSGRAKEMSGIACTFAGDGFVSSFTVPAVVVSPNMGPRTPPAAVKCVFDGRTKTVPLQPVNKTLTQIGSSVATGAAAGTVGVLVGGAVAAVQSLARDEQNDVFGYPDVTVTFD